MLRSAAKQVPSIAPIMVRMKVNDMLVKAMSF